MNVQLQNPLFKSYENVIKNAVENALKQNVKENIDVCKPMTEKKAILTYDKFKQAFPGFIQEHMDNLNKQIVPIDPQEINQKTFYHATTKENAQNILQNGFDIFKLNTATLSNGAHRVGNYVREIGPAVYLSPDKDSIHLYGNTILKANVNVNNPFITLRSMWCDSVEKFLSQLEQQSEKLKYTLQEKYVTANRFLHDFVSQKNIDAIFMSDDTGITTNQLAVFDPQKVKLQGNK